MDWLCHIVGVFLGSLLARLNAPFLKAAPLLFLTVTLAVAHSASAAWNQAANPASGSLGALEPCAGFDACASRCRIGQSVLSLYELASDDAVAARGAGGYRATTHGVNDKINRGVRSADELDALKNPLDVRPVKVDELGRPSQRYVGRKAEVVVNPETGAIVSVNPTSTKKAERLLRRQGGGE